MGENHRLSLAEICERVEVINASIERWKERPHVPTLHTSRGRERKTSEYYAGRFYARKDVLLYLEIHFGVADLGALFLLCQRHMSGPLSVRTRRMVAQTLADYHNGSALPCFVLATYVMLREEGQKIPALAAAE